MINFTRAMVSGLPRCFGAVVWFACAMPVCAADAPVVIQHGTVFDSVAGMTNTGHRNAASDRRYA